MEDCERLEIGHLIAQGYTSGRLDVENKPKGVHHISWKLHLVEWNDSEETPEEVKP